MNELDGRVIAIAGAGGGLGPAVAMRLADAGAILALADVTDDNARAVADRVGLPDSRVDARAVDLLDEKAAATWVSDLTEKFGKVDALIHLVGGWRGGDPIESFDLSDYEFLHDLLVRSVQIATRAFHHALTTSGDGRFILVSSSQAQHPEGTNAAYAAAKAAAETWTLALAEAFTDTGATSNVVVINAIASEQMIEDDPKAATNSDLTPSTHIAEAIAFLCSDAGGRMNGQRLFAASLTRGYVVMSEAGSAVSRPEGEPHGFGSDNHSGAHPEVIEAIAAANAGHATAYGDDHWTARATDLLREHFGPQSIPYLTLNGSGANVVALRAMGRGYDAVLCAETAHINVDEAAAPERIGEMKLIPIPAPDGKLTPDAVEARIERVGDPHSAQPRAISISQSTELGTIYTPAETGVLADLAHTNNMYLHIDGARLANAAASQDLSLKEITNDCGADIVSFGGTKNGLVMGEAVIVLRPELAESLEFLRKQSLQLASKMRYPAAQYIALLTDDLWKRSAAGANSMASRLAEGIAQIDGAELAYPAQANGVFVNLPGAAIESLHKGLPGEHPFHVWDHAAGTIRLMCSWDTTAEDVDGLLEAIRAAGQSSRA